MKNLLVKLACVGTLSALSAGVMAQGMPIEQEILSNLQRIRQITRRIEKRLPNMSPQRLEKVAERLQNALSALRPGGGQPGGQQLTVSGSVENEPFTLMASDASHLAVQCAQTFSQIGSADEMKISVNFQQEVSLSTGGWWKGAGEVCGVMAQAAIKQGLPAFNGPGYSLVGTIEHKTFVLEAPTLGELNLQCIDFYQSVVKGSSDEMVYFNGLEVVRENTGS